LVLEIFSSKNLRISRRRKIHELDKYKRSNVVAEYSGSPRFESQTHTDYADGGLSVSLATGLCGLR
jgi:hypothetical protein